MYEINLRSHGTCRMSRNGIVVVILGVIGRRSEILPLAPVASIPLRYLSYYPHLYFGVLDFEKSVYHFINFTSTYESNSTESTFYLTFY